MAASKREDPPAPPGPEEEILSDQAMLMQMVTSLGADCIESGRLDKLKVEEVRSIMQTIPESFWCLDNDFRCGRNIPTHHGHLMRLVYELLCLSNLAVEVGQRSSEDPQLGARIKGGNIRGVVLSAEKAARLVIVEREAKKLLAKNPYLTQEELATAIEEAEIPEWKQKKPAFRTIIEYISTLEKRGKITRARKKQ